MNKLLSIAWLLLIQWPGLRASLANLDAAEEAAEPDATEQDAEAILFEEGGA